MVSMRDRMSLSVPGSFRTLKDKVVGVPRMPEDPLERNRAELGDFDMLLTKFSATAERLRGALETLAQAPGDLLEHIARLYPEDRLTATIWPKEEEKKLGLPRLGFKVRTFEVRTFTTQPLLTHT